ncbi:hypothetical protein BX600DRAFT_435656 [Xylariales sp. PMI_506]|nr:hypothetical protein BX600DRAFT_435656 [Xylariales sp. PMI_506]
MSQVLARRSACDRCRDQKLRCPRITQDQQNNTDPCARCARAGAICVTSSPKPLGRPRAAAQGISAGLLDCQRVPGKSPPRKVQRRSAGPAGSPESTWTVLNDFPDLLNAPALDGGTAGLMGSDVAALLEGFEMPHVGIMMDQLAENTAPAEAYATADSAQQSDENFEDSSESGSLQDISVRLSRLNESMAHQLQKVQAYPWGSPVMYAMCSERMNSVSGNPLAEVLRSTSEFIGILADINKCADSASSTPSSLADSGIAVSLGNQAPHASSANSVASHSSGTSISTPAILLVLSSYIQLLQLYDLIFTFVYQTMLQLPTELIVSLPAQAASNFQVAGLGPVQGKLWVKLIMQIIQHQLESVEQILDVPTEFRLFGAPTCPKNGVFSNTGCLALVELVMNRPEECPGKSGASTVQSLRQGIQQVQSLVESTM